MTNERKKSIIILIATLIFGILLGLLVPGAIHKFGERGVRSREGHGIDGDAGHKKDWFTGTLYRVIQPDSLQAQKIRPILANASNQIDSLEISSNNQLAAVLDSVKQQLKPLLTDDQWSRLNEFDTRAKNKWRGRGKGHR
jgi:hypothetical protein